MININRIVKGKIIDENNETYFVQYDGSTFQFDKLESQSIYHQGDSVEGYIYTDKDNHQRIQIKVPKIIKDEYSWGTVVSQISHLGVFVDVGFINKDIVISIDDLPEDQSEWPKSGDKLFVRLEIDGKGRFWGKIANREEIKIIEKAAPPRLMNQDIIIHILDNKGVGYSGISEEGYITFIHESQVTQPLRLGQVVDARVIEVHKDGRINVSMRPRSYEVLDEDAQMILALLSKSPENFLPFHDKSDPQEITNFFGISKSQFKRAIGRLMKDNKIKQIPLKGIFIKKENVNE